MSEDNNNSDFLTYPYSLEASINSKGYLQLSQKFRSLENIDLDKFVKNFDLAAKKFKKLGYTLQPIQELKK